MVTNDPEKWVAIRDFAEFSEMLTPDDTPFTTMLDGPPKPDYYYPTRTVMVEPYHHLYVKLKSILNDIQEDRCPDDEWEDDCEWTPSAAYLDLQDLSKALYKLAHTTEFNPKYDMHKSLEWDREHPPRGPLNQKKVEWGQGYYVPVDDPGKFDEGTVEEAQEDE